MRQRSRGLAALVFAACVLASWLLATHEKPAAAGGADQKINKFPPTGRVAPNIVRQGFPANASDPSDLTKSDTAWEIDWFITNPGNAPHNPKNTVPSSVLAIRSAKFMHKDRKGQPRWLTVLNNLELAEVFAPYDTTEPTFLDVTTFNFWIVPAKKEYLGPNCVLPGEILPSADPRMANKVMKEVHDDGPRWLNRQEKSRRGEKMTVWCIFYAGNYRYFIEYGFSDDGILSARIGATAHNYHPKQADQRDVHLHTGCWRFDPVIGDPLNPSNGGADKNVVRLVRRVPNTKPGTFRVDVAPFPLPPGGQGQATEGAAEWKAEEFTLLRMQSTVRKNNNNVPQPSGYDLFTQRVGSVRNVLPAYAFANHDYWVTRTNPGHIWYKHVPQYAAAKQTIDLQPVTVWHNTALLHVPRAEDFGPDGASPNTGLAITAWAGFMLRPLNVFDGSPLYP